MSIIADFFDKSYILVKHYKLKPLRLIFACKLQPMRFNRQKNAAPMEMRLNRSDLFSHDEFYTVNQIKP